MTSRGAISMKKAINSVFKGILAGVLTLLNVIPSISVIFNPLFFIMFLPFGVYAFLSWPWLILKDIPDPFHPGESLYWLTYAIKVEEDNLLLPSLFRWGVLDFSLLVIGSAIFLIAFFSWLANLKRAGGLLTSGIYKVSRHPQYFGIILLTLGVSLRTLRPISLIAWITLLFCYLILASLEERVLFKTYGDRYKEYSKSTAFMIPLLKLKVPELLSPKKPLRYMLFAAFYFLLVAAILAGMRNMVFALRNIAYLSILPQF